MNAIEQFIESCHEAIGRYDQGKYSMHEAASKIHAKPWESPLPEYAHPMLDQVAALAFDVAENYRSLEEDKHDWELLVDTLDKYEKGEWEPSCWLLGVMYGKYEEGRLVHSFSTIITRQNGKTDIQTAQSELESAFKEIDKRINPKQTDERYLQNFIKLLPKKIGDLNYTNSDCSEYLTDRRYYIKRYYQNKSS